MRSSTLTSQNTAFYSTANTGYAVYAANSLLSIRKHLPDAKLFIFSSGLSSHDRRVLERNKIQYFEIDYNSRFNKTWDYPVECYYLFAGPEILYSNGYEYSVYIDGDVLCAANPLNNLPVIESFAGVGVAKVDGLYSSIFQGDWARLMDIYGLSKDKESQKRVNAGVVYFNNREMSDFGLLDRATEIYKKYISEGVPRKGDDSLFSLIQYIYFDEDEITFLPPAYNFVLQFHEEWPYPVPNLVFFHFSIDKPWKLSPYRHDKSKLNAYNPYVKRWRNLMRETAPGVWLRLLAQFRYSDTFTRTGDRVVSLCRDQLMWVGGLKRSIVQRRANVKKSPLKTYWWRDGSGTFKNFGDEITSDIVHKIFGYRIKRSKLVDSELLGAGSVIEMACRRSSDNSIYVWGSGFIRPEEKLSYDGLVFTAVRGQLSRDRVDGEVALGDPGLLASLVYRKAGYKTSKIGFVVHYAELDLPIVDRIQADPRFTLISPLDSPADVAMKISSCRFVFSSSLHGLIFSDSFGVPNIHTVLSERLVGGDYKFKDYYSGVGLDYRAADIDSIFEDEYINSLIDTYQPIRKLRKIQRSLIRAFPKKIR